MRECQWPRQLDRREQTENEKQAQRFAFACRGYSRALNQIGAGVSTAIRALRSAEAALRSAEATLRSDAAALHSADAYAARQSAGARLWSFSSELRRLSDDARGDDLIMSLVAQQNAVMLSVLSPLSSSSSSSPPSPPPSPSPPPPLPPPLSSSDDGGAPSPERPRAQAPPPRGPRRRTPVSPTPLPPLHPRQVTIWVSGTGGRGAR